MTLRRKTKSGSVLWLDQILHREGLDPTTRIILFGLANHVGEDDRCYVGLARLADYTEVSTKTVSRRLSELVEQGLLRRERRRREGGEMGVYEFIFDRAAWGVDADPPADNLSTGDGSTSGQIGGSPADKSGGTSGHACVSAQKEPLLEGTKKEPPLPLVAEATEELGAVSAGLIVKGYIDWCDANGKARPGSPGMVGRSVAALLSSGWSVPEIKQALTQTRAYSVPAIEFVLNASRQASAKGPAAKFERGIAELRRQEAVPDRTTRKAVGDGR